MYVWVYLFLWNHDLFHSFNANHSFLNACIDGYDFTGGLYTVQFQAIGDHNTLSSMVEIPIRNDFIPESTECFTCVILKPRENGLVLDCLNTINIEIEDDDGEYCRAITVIA